MGERKTTKVSSAVKARLEELKGVLDLKNESQVVAYLLAMYDDYYPRTTILKHKKYQEIAIGTTDEGA